MKVKESNIQSNRPKVSQHVLVVIGLLMVIVIVMVINAITSMTLKETVNVVVFKTGMPAESIITEDNLVAKEMLKSEYEKEGVITLADGTQRRQVILYDDRELILNAYTSYYIREGTPLYWDSLTKELTKTTSYLYEMDGELVKLALSGDEFGRLVVPGDNVNIRVRYTEPNYTLPTEEEYIDATEKGIELNEDVEVQTMLFNNATILDMLNGDGNSIFDNYYKFISLPKDQQAAALASDEFKKAVQPGEILLCVTSEEADMYMNIKSKSPTYMITLLPRTGSNVILNALSGLETD